MRAKEFIKEATDGDMNDHFKGASRGVIRARDIGGYDRTYHMNRLLMAAAMADGKSSAPVKDIDAASWIEKYNVIVPYTDEEHLMILAAMATIPTDSKELLKRSKSKEPEDTNVTSPIANWMKKK